MVVCAVKLCRNYTGKNIKPPEGISFHRFPTDPDHKQDWIEAIQRSPDWNPGAHCRVCSVHFENVDFKVSETGRRVLLKDAVPSKNLYQEERCDVGYQRRVVRKIKSTKPQPSGSELLEACRFCLVTDVRLYNVHDSEMREALSQVTSLGISKTDGLPQHMCNICWALLIKCAEFKTRCENAQDVLEELRSKDILTTELIRTVDRNLHNLVTPLTIKKQKAIDVTDIDIKQENIDLISNGDDNLDDNYDIFDEEPSNDINIIKEISNIKSEFDEHRQNEGVFASLIAKDEIFVETSKELKIKHEKKRKIQIKKITDKKDDIRNTKARKTDEDYLNFSKQFCVDVIFLSLDEQISEVQSRRESDNYKNSKYKCEQCFKGFSGENAFKNHKAKHDPTIGSYVCGPCGFRFPKRYKMLHHLSHHKMNFVCKICGHISKLPSKAKEHFNWHNGAKYPCHFCDKSFIKRTSQFNHMRNRHGSACCDLCQEVFSGERGLSAHIIKAHQQAIKSRCESCGVQFLTEESLNRHLSTSPDGICLPGTKSCPQCGDNFTSDEELIEHSRSNHWKEIRCEKCNAIFENEKLYKMHSLTHKESRQRRPRTSPASPGQSGQSGQSAGGRRPHIQQRMCEMCGLTWRSAAALRYHQRVHTGEKPHQCPICPKTFRIQDSLQIHMNTHTGARPFKCPHCPKAFKSRTQNHKHQLVHTKVRRYRCDLCDKTFQTSTCVKTHIKTVHMKIPLPPRARKRQETMDNTHMGHLEHTYMR